MRVWFITAVSFVLLLATDAEAATTNASGDGTGNELNITAIAMFFVFIAVTLVITFWAASRTRTRSDFYAAGSSIGGFQNGLAFVFGTAGLPHVLMRFFTVPDARQARRSVAYAIGFIGYFQALIFIIGLGAVVYVSNNPEFQAEGGGLIGGVNMAAVHLSKVIGGDLFLGFISAVAFATILAVVSGLSRRNYKHD